MNPEKGYNCVLPNDLKIHRSTALTRVLKDIICININTKEIRELTILQIKSLLIYPQDMYIKLLDIGLESPRENDL